MHHSVGMGAWRVKTVLLLLVVVLSRHWFQWRLTFKNVTNTCSTRTTHRSFPQLLFSILHALLIKMLFISISMQKVVAINLIYTQSYPVRPETFLDNPRRTMMYSKMLILQAKYKPSADRWNSDTNVGEWQQPLAAENWRWRSQFPTHTVANDSLTFILMQKFLLPPVIFYKQVQTNTP